MSEIIGNAPQRERLDEIQPSDWEELALSFPDFETHLINKELAKTNSSLNENGNFVGEEDTLNNLKAHVTQKVFESATDNEALIRNWQAERMTKQPVPDWLANPLNSYYNSSLQLADAWQDRLNLLDSAWREPNTGKLKAPSAVDADRDLYQVILQQVRDDPSSTPEMVKEVEQKLQNLDETKLMLEGGAALYDWMVEQRTINLKKGEDEFQSSLPPEITTTQVRELRYDRVRLREKRRDTLEKKYDVLDTQDYEKVVFGNYDAEQLSQEMWTNATKLPKEAYQEILKSYTEKGLQAGDTMMVGYLSEYLNFDPPELQYYRIPEDAPKDLPQRTIRGMYLDDRNAVTINLDNYTDLKQHMTTLSHELWHAHQCRVREIGTEKGRAYYFNFCNYIKTRTDYVGYRNQLVEREADAFGAAFANRAIQVYHARETS